MKTARILLVLAAAMSVAGVGIHECLHSPQLTFGQRVGALCFHLLIAAIGIGHFAYRVQQS